MSILLFTVILTVSGSAEAVRVISVLVVVGKRFFIRWKVLGESIALMVGVWFTFSNRTKLKNIIGERGLEWIILTYFSGVIIISIFISINTFVPDLAGLGDIFMATYIIGVGINIINLEYQIVIKDRNLLKDKFSHDITNYNQYFVMGIEMLQLEKERLSKNSQVILKSIQKQLTESNEILDKIRKL